MGFLRRLFGGGPEGPRDPENGASSGDAKPAGDDEGARDRELLRADARRLEDDLLQRQLRYADRSWTPPRQGGPRRADDARTDEDGGGS